MSSNLKRGPLDSFFSPRQKKSNSNVDIAVAGPSVVPHNEKNNDIEDNNMIGWLDVIQKLRKYIKVGPCYGLMNK